MPFLKEYKFPLHQTFLRR